MTRFAFLLPLIAGTCWGFTGVFVRTLNDAGFDNITITFSRVVVMVVILLISTWVYDKSLFHVKKRDLAMLAVMAAFVTEAPVKNSLFLLAHALVASLLPNLLYSIAFVYVDSGVASILASGAEPTSALLFGLLVYREVPTVFGVIGMAIVVISMIMLSRTDAKSSQVEKGDQI